MGPPPPHMILSLEEDIGIPREEACARYPRPSYPEDVRVDPDRLLEDLGDIGIRWNIGSWYVAEDSPDPFPAGHERGSPLDRPVAWGGFYLAGRVTLPG